MATNLRFKPINLARWIIWGAFALALLVLPLMFHQGFALTLLCQIGTVMIFSLAFNMLLGQAGMLSFGHAVYSGLGAYIAIHALNYISKSHFPFRRTSDVEWPSPARNSSFGADTGCGAGPLNSIAPISDPPS